MGHKNFLVKGQPQRDRDLGLPKTGIGGRFVSVYTPEIALEICERIAEGETLSKICEKPGLPARQTFGRWVVNEPTLARAYAAARELSAHALEEEALDSARHIKANPVNSHTVRAYEVAMNQFRWSASRRNPRVYSERGSVHITVPIQINTSLDLGDGSTSQGTSDHPDIYKLIGRVEVPEETPMDNKTLAQQGDQPLVEPGLKKKRYQMVRNMLNRKQLDLDHITPAQADMLGDPRKADAQPV